MRIKTCDFLEVKAVGEDGTIEGYGSVFGNVDSYGDIVLPGAFAKTLAAWGDKGGLPPILWQHKSSEPIGVWTAMAEDAKGLKVTGRLLVQDDPVAARAYAHLKAGSISGLSIGYSVPEGGEAFDPATGVNRLSCLNLYEVSVVTFPANEAAQVDRVRSRELLADPRALETVLRDAGLSRGAAKAILAGGLKAAQAERDARTLDAPTQDGEAIVAALESVKAAIAAMASR